MAKEIMYFGGDAAGFVQAYEKVNARLDALHSKVSKVTKDKGAMVGILDKISNRLLIAGGAALGFSATVGRIRAGIQEWNQLLQESEQHLNTTIDAARNLFSMLPIEKVPGALGEIRRQAYISPLSIESITSIKEFSLSLLSEVRGFTEEQRAEMERGMEGLARAWAIPPEGIAEMMGKAAAMMAGAGMGGRQWANMMMRMFKEAGFAGKRLEEWGPQMPKFFGAAELAGLTPEETVAMMTALSQITGTPSQAMMGGAMMLRRLQAPETLRRMGLPPTAKGYGIVERFYEMAQAGQIRPEEYEEIFGERAMERAATFIQQYPSLMAKYLPLYRGVAEEGGWAAEQRIAGLRALSPEYLRREERRISENRIRIEKMAEAYDVAATGWSLMQEAAWRRTAQDPVGWAARKLMYATYKFNRFFGVPPEEAMAGAMGGFLPGEQIRGLREEMRERLYPASAAKSLQNIDKNIQEGQHVYQPERAWEE